MGHKKSKKHLTQTQPEPVPEPVPEPNNDDQLADYLAAPVNDVEAEPSAAVSKPVIVACLPAGKHPAKENEEDKPSSKRLKESTQDDSKKLFQRVFTEEDEAKILKGLLEFKAQKGEDSESINRDDEFFEAVKDKLHVEVTKAQVMTKLKRLKKRFVNAKRKKHLTYDEKKFFELSKKIWGDEDDNGGVIKVEAKDEDNDNGGVAYKEAGKFRVGEKEVVEMMRAKALKRMGKKGRAELREMWRKVEVAQMRVDSLRCQAQMVENQKIMEALEFINSTTSENLNGDLQLE